MARLLLGALALLLAVAHGAERPVTLPGAADDGNDGSKTPIPEHFDARAEFYGCADNVLNQARACVRRGAAAWACGSGAARGRRQAFCCPTKTLTFDGPHTRASSLRALHRRSAAAAGR
jgi:hypothetical protein